jgi:4-amino-4-deoxy-L-arabinose transferase-like glycosyltransferase
MAFLASSGRCRGQSDCRRHCVALQHPPGVRPWLAASGASDAAAIGASILLGLTPTHLLHGRFACDYLLPVPCVLVWFILLVDADKSHTSWRFFAAGAALGLGLYTYIAAVVLMPVFLALTYLTLFLKGVRRVRPYAALTAGFILLVLPLANYLVALPQLPGLRSVRRGQRRRRQQPSRLFRQHLAQRWTTYRSWRVVACSTMPRPTS